MHYTIPERRTESNSASATGAVRLAHICVRVFLHPSNPKPLRAQTDGMTLAERIESIAVKSS